MINKLQKMYEQMEKFQETDVAQNDDPMMWLIGEVMGSIDDLIDYIIKENYGGDVNVTADR